MLFSINFKHIKIPLIASSTILLILLMLLIISSVDALFIYNLMFIEIIVPLSMILLAYFRGIEVSKGMLDQRFTKGLRSFFPHPLKADNPELTKCFLSQRQYQEGKRSIFFRLLIGLWGVSTSLVSTTVQIGLLLGVDKIPNSSSHALIQLPPPTVWVGFILFGLLFGLPIGFRLLIPAAIMKTANLRYVYNDDLIGKIPSYDWNKLSGIAGITSFIFVFSHDLLTDTISQLNQLALFGIADIILIGIPLVVFCLFYAYSIEPSLKPKMIAYLRDDLKIRVGSTQIN